MPTSEVSEQTLRMLPPWGIRRAAAWAQKKAPFRLVSTIRSHSASVTSSDAQGSSMPALLIRISIRDIDPKTVSNAASMLELTLTSAVTCMTARPCAAIAACAALSACVSRPNNATAAPARARADARAPPIPRDAPVTAATLPSSEKSSGSMPGLSYVRAPAAEFRDVGGLRRAMSFAYESRHFSTILQFDLADPQRRGNARHERTERFRGESPDLDVDCRAAVGDAHEAGTMRRPARQGKQSIA